MANDPATVSGTVTDLDSGLPIAGATVAFGQPPFELATTQTAADGTYTLLVDMLGSPTRSGYLEAAGPEHAPARLVGEPLSDCHFSCGGGDGLVELSAGQVLGNQDVALVTGGRASGSVVASTGAPLAGVGLETFSALSGTFYTAHFRATSATDGSWEQPLALRPGDDFRMIAETPPGLNFVSRAWNARNCQYRACAIVSADPLPIVAGVVTPGIDFALQPGASLSGTLLPDNTLRFVLVFDAAGVLLNGANAVLTPGQSAWQVDRLAGGSYYIQLGPPIGGASNLVRQLHNGLPCPAFGCERASGAPITVPVAGIRDGIDVTLVEGGSISARIIDGDTGLVPDLLIDPSNPGSLGQLSVIDGAGEVVSGGVLQTVGGEVRMLQSAALAPGNYFVRTHDSWTGGGLSYVPPTLAPVSLLDGYSDAVFQDVPCAGLACDLGLAAPVSVMVGETTEITIEVVKGSMLSGQVIDDATDEGIAGSVVELVDAGNHRLAATTTNSAGEFSFGAFPAGGYYLRTAMSGLVGFGTMPRQHAYFDRVFGADGSCSEQLCDPGSGTLILVDGENDAGPFELRVEAGPVIRGQVVDSLSGLYVNRGSVEVFTASGSFVGRFSINSLTGLYQTTALPPGTYSLEPRVSPAFVPLPPGSANPAAGFAAATAVGGFTVELGEEDVELSLTVVDLAQATIYSDRFDGSMGGAGTE